MLICAGSSGLGRASGFGQCCCRWSYPFSGPIYQSHALSLPHARPVPLKPLPTLPLPLFKPCARPTFLVCPWWFMGLHRKAPAGYTVLQQSRAWHICGSWCWWTNIYLALPPQKKNWSIRDRVHKLHLQKELSLCGRVAMCKLERLSPYHGDISAFFDHSDILKIALQANFIDIFDFPPPQTRTQHVHLDSLEGGFRLSRLLIK